MKATAGRHVCDVLVVLGPPRLITIVDMAEELSTGEILSSSIFSSS
jgi:hypothetical protein